MTALAWIVTRLLAAGLWVAALGAVGYFIVFPAIVRAGYRAEGVSLDRFKLQGGEGASGSEDAVYFAARYDCRRAITRISGTAPDALYWMIGIYDDRLQRIPGGHLNDATVEVDAEGRFRLTIQPLPGPLSTTLECGRHRRGLILVRVFLPRDRARVVAPDIERIPTA
jgi:hypothetical protein